MSGTRVGTFSKLTKTPVTYLATIAGIALIAVAIPVGAAEASSTPASPTVGTVDVSTGITLTGLPASFTLTGIPGATAETDSAVSMLVTTNNGAGYAVTVEAAGATLAGTGTNADVIPIAALMVRETPTDANASSGPETWTPSSNTAPVTVHSQATRSLAGGDTVTNDYKMLIPAVAADTYTQTLNYVATTL